MALTSWVASRTVVSRIQIRTVHFPSVAEPSPVDSGNVKAFDRIPGPRGIYGLPLIGTAFQLHPFSQYRKTQLNLFFRDLHKKYGKLVRVRIGTRWDVFAFDPDHIQCLMMQEGRYPNRIVPPILEAYYTHKGTGNGFSMMQGEEWHAKRITLQNLITPGSVYSYLPAQNSVADDLVAWLDRNHHANVDVADIITRYVVDVNAVIAFNSKMGFLVDEVTHNYEDNRQYLESSKQAFHTFAESIFRIPLFKYFKTRTYRDFETSMDNVLRYTQEKIVGASKRSQALLESRENILVNMLQSKTYKQEDIVLAMHILLFAGIHSTSATIQWFLWLLSGNTLVQEKLHQEISKSIGREQEIDSKTLAHMPYLKACLKECFRLIFPSIGGSMRIMPEDGIVDGYFIPKGTYVHFGHNALCGSDEYFENPQEFLPERWLSGNNDQDMKRRMSFVVMPFGFGPRSCLGKRFAEQEIHLAIIKILQKFKLFRDVNKEEPKVLYHTIAFPSHPLPIRFTKRCNPRYMHSNVQA